MLDPRDAERLGGHHEGPGGIRRDQEGPGGTRRNQEEPGGRQDDGLFLMHTTMLHKQTETNMYTHTVAHTHTHAHTHTVQPTVQTVVPYR